MLVQSEAPLKEIASVLRFADVNHFAKVLRRLQHVSSAAYRQSMR
jgi:AraC-like DNA-binding protein